MKYGVLSADYNQFGFNGDVAKNIDAYLDKTEGKFAVLLKGEWGCGKTFFIKSYIKQKQLDLASAQTSSSNTSQETQFAYCYAKFFRIISSIKNCIKQKLAGMTVVETSSPNNSQDTQPTFCYVSLFSITSQSELDSAILAKANPSFNSATTKNLGRFAIWALERIPGASPEISKIASKGGNLLNVFFNNFPKKLIIILDDLERSKLHFKEILGYVNSLLEENNAKVILVCHENEIGISTDNGEQKELYYKMKEKIIGITQTIKPDPKTILEKNIEAVKNEQLKLSFVANIEYINNIIETYQYKNLRTIESFIFEAELIVLSLNDNVLSNTQCMQEILRTLFIFSNTIKKNEIAAQDILGYLGHTMVSDNPKEGKSTIKIFSEKYKEDLAIFETSLCKFWADFFGSGVIGKELSICYEKRIKAEESLDQTPLRLWSMMGLSAREFETLKRQMLTELKNGSYSDPIIILHAFGLLIFMNKKGLLAEGEANILQGAAQYIDQYCKLECIDSFNGNIDSDFGCYGKQYCSQGTEEFKSIKLTLETRMSALQKDKDKIHSEELFILLDSPDKFIGKIIHYDVPKDDCFCYIDPQEFYKKLALHPKRWQIFNACVKATAYSQQGKRHEDIRNWFLGVYNAFQQDQNLLAFDRFIWGELLTRDDCWAFSKINLKKTSNVE